MSTMPVVDDFAGAAYALANRFAEGGRLVVAAPGRPDHAHHVAVEFIHPVITGARPLPAMATSSLVLASVARPADAVLVIESDEAPPPTLPTGVQVFTLPASLPDHEVVLAYHLLWELVQLCLEKSAPATAQAGGAGDSTGFLYPFLESVERDAADLLDSLRSSAEAKRAQSQRLGEHTVAANEDTLRSTTTAILKRLGRGGTVVAMGNGGSSTDAAGLVRRLRRSGASALDLTADPAVLTALANDLGADHIFARQAEALLTGDDVLIAFSTSGDSPNLHSAMDVAARVGAAGVAICGYGGGSLARHRAIGHALLVESESVHRIQEAQNRLVEALVAGISRELEVAA